MTYGGMVRWEVNGEGHQFMVRRDHSVEPARPFDSAQGSHANIKLCGTWRGPPIKSSGHPSRLLERPVEVLLGGGVRIGVGIICCNKPDEEWSERIRTAIHCRHYVVLDHDAPAVKGSADEGESMTACHRHHMREVQTESTPARHDSILSESSQLRARIDTPCRFSRPVRRYSPESLAISGPAFCAAEKTSSPAASPTRTSWWSIHEYG